MEDDNETVRDSDSGTCPSQCSGIKTTAKVSIGSNDSERIVLGGRGGDKSHPQNNIPLKVSWADIVTGKR